MSPVICMHFLVIVMITSTLLFSCYPLFKDANAHGYNIRDNIDYYGNEVGVLNYYLQVHSSIFSLVPIDCVHKNLANFASNECTANTNNPLQSATSGTEGCSFTVPDVPSLVPQDQFCNSYTCWASALTMMLSYKDHQSYSIDTVLKRLGKVYVDKYNNNQGIAPEEFIQISSKLGLIGQSGFLDPFEIKDMLQRFGPIMIVDAENPNDPSSMHARLIIGINEDCTSSNSDIGDTELIILDPSNPNNGNPIAEPLDLTSSKFTASNWGIILHL